MNKLADNYVVECTTAEETNKVMNYIRKDSKVWSHWKYVLNSAHLALGFYSISAPHPFLYSLLINWLAGSKLVIFIFSPSHFKSIYLPLNL